MHQGREETAILEAHHKDTEAHTGKAGIDMKNYFLLYEKNYKIIFWCVIVLLMLFAFSEPKPVDDAFISFRYAKNLVEGHGLVYNPGERVEGYSNFLWVMLMAAGDSLGVQPERFAIILSAPIYLACLILSYLIAVHVLKNRNLGFLTMILVGTNWSVSSFVTSGLETPLQLLIFLITAYIITQGIENGWNIRRSTALSLVLNIALLTRPDSIVLVAVGLFFYFISYRDLRLTNLIAIAAPFILLTAPYLIWKLGYYGSILPNPYHAKVHGLSGIVYGLFYVYLFSLCYLLLPYFVLIIFHWKKLLKPRTSIGYILACVTVWTIYVAAVGGDFMEFRFFVPVIPLLMIVIMYTIHTFVSGKRLRYGLILVLLLGTLNNSLAFGKLIGGWGVQNVDTLSRPLIGTGKEWIRIGKTLGELFGGTDVTIALGMAGAIPYYSGLKTVDMMGMNDAEIPRIGRELSIMAGHRIIAPLSYIMQREVNLVLWPNNYTFDIQTFHRWAEQAEWEELYRYYLDIDVPIDGLFINEAHLLGIPLGNDLITVAWYLTPHEAVEKAIQDGKFHRIRLVRPGYDRFDTFLHSKE